MVKKILTNLMQKPKILDKEKPQKPENKKKKYQPKYPDPKSDQINDLSKKIECIALTDQSDQQIPPMTPRTKSITKKKTVKKSLEKEPKKSPKKQTKLVDDEALQAEYKKFLDTLCPQHSTIYHKKTTKQQAIPIEWFKQLKLIWKSDKEDKNENAKTVSKQGKSNVLRKTEKIMDVQNITAEFMKRLKPKHWLNDEVINSYIELIELDMIKKNASSKKDDFSVCLVKTYFSALKMAPQRIQRQIRKRALNDKTLLIVPINEDFHWFFLLIFDRKIYVFDSILKRLKSEKDLTMAKKCYAVKEPIKKCIKLYEKMCKSEEMDISQMVIVSDFPQQDNEFDCGMMMLCGIKNLIAKFHSAKRQEEMKRFHETIEGKNFWTFCIQDIRYLRFMFSREILEETLILN